MPKPIVPKGFSAPLGMYSHGMIVAGGELVVVAGQVGVRPDGGVAGADVVAQTRQALENVRAVLEAAGASMRDVVRFQTFLTSADDIQGFMKARAEVFPEYFPDGVYPPNTLLVISRLVHADLVVEIEAMAVLPDRASRLPAKTARPDRRGPARRGGHGTRRRR
jgi:enamine deaminase RidA (YjgF/YER057c/UK114 family)